MSKYNSISQKGRDPKPPPWDVKTPPRKRDFIFLGVAFHLLFQSLCWLSIPSRDPSTIPLAPAPLPKPLYHSLNKDLSSVFALAPAPLPIATLSLFEQGPIFCICQGTSSIRLFCKRDFYPKVLRMGAVVGRTGGGGSIAQQRVWKCWELKKKKNHLSLNFHCTCQCSDQAKPAWPLVWQSRLVSVSFTLRLCRCVFLFLSSFLCVPLWVSGSFCVTCSPFYPSLCFSLSLWVSLTFSLHVSLSQITS